METLDKGLTMPLERENTTVTNLEMRKNEILKKKVLGRKNEILRRKCDILRRKSDILKRKCGILRGKGEVLKG